MDNVRRIHFAPFALDLVNECLWRGSEQIKLRPKAYAVLEHLVARHGQLVTKEDLLAAVWQDTFVGDAVLKVAVRQIREALSDDPRTPTFIETAHRRGYRFIGPLTGAPDGTPAITAAATATRAAAEPSGSAPPTGGVVGRAAALSRMQDWLDACRAGERQVVFVTGEAGIGKTTLLDAFTRSLAVDPAVRICAGQCLEQYGMGEAYLPVLEAIRQLCRSHSAAIDVLRSHAPMWLLQMPSLTTPSEREALAREAFGGSRDRMLREMAETLEAMAAQAPLVMLLEDLHWSDVSTLDLISYVARRRHPAHLMVIGTFRQAELIASGHPLKPVQRELLGRQLCVELPLDYLSARSIGEHLAARFPGHRFPGGLAAVIHERTEGNPLFMVNTLDHLVAEGLIDEQPGGWCLTAPIDAVKVGVPESIRHLIETQVDRLEPDDQRTLEAASVVGADFSIEALAAALGEAAAALEDRCERLSRRHQFIREAGAQVLPNGQTVGRYGFLHAVYRHVLYERISAGRLAALHLRIAEGAEAVYGERSREIAAELAMHFERAAHYLQAARYLQQAAGNATGRAAFREAITLCRHALGLLARVPDSIERARLELWLRMTLGVPLIATEGYAAASVGEEYERARTLCDQVAPAPELSQVLWGLWTFRALKADLSAAREIASEYLVLADRFTDSGLAMRGHWAMEITCTHRGEFALALEHFNRALALYQPHRSADDSFLDALNPGVALRCFAGWSLWFSGQPDLAVSRAQEAVALARRLAEPHGLAHALVFAAVLHQLRREPALAREHADMASRLSEDHGLALYQAMAGLLSGWALIESDGPAAAIAQIRRGLAAWESTGAQLMRPHFLGLLAEAMGAASEHAAAVAVLEQALQDADRTGERSYEAELYRLKGVQLLTAASSELAGGEAQVCFERALAIAGRQGARALELRTATSMARLHLSRGRPDLGVAVLLPAYSRFSEGLDTPDLRDARAFLDACALP